MASSGEQCRLIFPLGRRCMDIYRLWVTIGGWEQLNAALVEQVRTQAGREPQPSLSMIDSQSLKMALIGGKKKGFDGNKKVKGRKCHIVVDVMELVLSCFVSAANVADVKAAPVVLVWVLEMYGHMEKVLADQSYRGELGEQIRTANECVLEITQRLGEGFIPEPMRWIVERTFSWLENARALCREDERLQENHEGMIYVVMIWLMLRRLGKNRRTRQPKSA